jgi:hypothetical protein
MAGSILLKSETGPISLEEEEEEEEEEELVI